MKKIGGAVVMVGDNLSSPVETGLSDQQNIGGAPPVPAPLNFRKENKVSIWHSNMIARFNSKMKILSPHLVKMPTLPCQNVSNSL